MRWVYVMLCWEAQGYLHRTMLHLTVNVLHLTVNVGAECAMSITNRVGQSCIIVRVLLNGATMLE